VNEDGKVEYAYETQIKTLMRSMERINQNIAKNEARESRTAVVVLASIVKDLSNTQELTNHLNYIHKLFLKPAYISLPTLLNCIKQV